MATTWGQTPRQSILSECARVGTRELVSACLDVLSGQPLDPALGYVLAGPASRPVIEGREGGASGYWPKVWALRALLYAWNPVATARVIERLSDPAWRVREMAAKVVARQRLDEALESLGALEHDDVARVRRAAQRAVMALVAAG
ncbi:MAG TPA: HEAT repeat domain-containing protein [Acidimicrobiales bacterium]|nr:HEAT repeat domain-containing protein [Acidimicrobiales bacterium]